ncbi:MAG: hypothetical protein ACI8UO_000767 [Verrucomicrobiales bacterium]|jgi:hypothetical protein
MKQLIFSLIMAMFLAQPTLASPNYGNSADLTEAVSEGWTEIELSVWVRCECTEGTVFELKLVRKPDGEVELTRQLITGFSKINHQSGPVKLAQDEAAQLIAKFLKFCQVAEADVTTFEHFDALPFEKWGTDPRRQEGLFNSRIRFARAVVNSKTGGRYFFNNRFEATESLKAFRWFGEEVQK